MEWYIAVLKQYIAFSGRAHRREFWMFLLIHLFIVVVLSFVSEFLSSVYTLAVLLPALGVSVRRLHDSGKSGWWLLLHFIPMVGTLILLVLMALEGDPGPNRYGPPPQGLPVT